MTDDEIKALKEGDAVYRVDRYTPLSDDVDESYRVVEYTFAAKKVTDVQVKRDRCTIRLTEAPRGVEKHVTFSMLRGFYRSAREAVDAFKQKQIDADVDERRKYERGVESRSRAKTWASRWDGKVIR